MSRLTSFATQLVAVAALATPAAAEGQHEIAEKLNGEGRALMFDGKYAEASAKFREAVARVPDAKYFFNLCTSYFQEGKFGEAMTACNAVANNKPSPELQAKADKLIGRIETEAKAQGIELRPTGGGGGDPNLPGGGDPSVPPDPSNPPVGPVGPTGPTGQGPTTYAPAAGRPPEQGVFQAVKSDNKYTWTLGVDLFGGGGRIGQQGFYGSASSGIRFKGDYMMNPVKRVGAQGYLQISNLGQGEEQTAAVDSLAIFDVGVAGYKHLCPRVYERLCLTPLVGVHFAFMSPANEQNVYGEQVFNYAALGGRAELGLQWGLGRRMEHVLGVQIGVNIYSAVFSGPENNASLDMLTIEQAGLDRGGVAGYLGVGYTYRFNTPLGSAAFVTLE